MPRCELKARAVGSLLGCQYVEELLSVAMDRQHPNIATPGLDLSERATGCASYCKSASGEPCEMHE